MALHLDDHQDALLELGEPAAQVLRSVWNDAARVFTQRGLQTWLAGAQGLKSLGRSPELVLSYLESTPQVAREIGEQAAFDLLSAAIKMYAKTSASVLSLVFSSAPVAARRLGDAQLFADYLQLLDKLLSQAPRSLRPMLERLDLLLGQLTLGGLRRWALWGAHAHRSDFDAQLKYFSLESPQALAVLQKERRGTLFVDVQRRLNMFLRALWGRDFWMRPTSGDMEEREGYRPFIEGHVIHLPDAFDDLIPPDGGVLAGLEIYRAAAMHAAAHVVFSRCDPDWGEAHSPLVRALTGLVEDARIEVLAARRFPGMAQLWSHLLAPLDAQDPSTSGLLTRIAAALADSQRLDDHPLVLRAREGFAAVLAQPLEAAAVQALGLALAEQFEALGLEFKPHSDGVQALYRDDNRYLWQLDDGAADAVASGVAPGAQVRKQVSLMEMINAVDVEGAGDDAQEIWVLPTELFDDDGVSFNAREGKEPVAAPVYYAEWDYQSQLERPLWCTVQEKRPPLGDPAQIAALIEQHKPLVARIKRLIEAVQPEGLVRQRRQEDGDEIDLNAAVASMLDARLGFAPDPRVGIRMRRHVRDVAVLLLIDLSESTNERVRGLDGTERGEATVLSLAREAAALMADALDRIGDPFAIHGFDSNGRHDVEYFRFKDFDAPYGDKARAGLAGMSGKLSTRLGAAMRHAGSWLARQPQRKKLLLVLTDGEPADNDVRDPQYLRMDARKAVEDLTRSGVQSYCLTLDPLADEYVERIFGVGRYLVLDKVARLPEKLSTLYLGLTR